MRKNNKGFMLIETLLVSVFVVSTLIFIYIQFEKVRNSYQTSFAYNTTNGVYGANTVLKYLRENGIENLEKEIDKGSAYIDLTNCPGGYLSNTSFCHRLLTDLKVQKIFYVSSDVTNFKNKMNQAAISNKFKSFVHSIKPTNDSGYRLLIEYQNEEYATILTKVEIVDSVPTPTPTPKPTPTPTPATCSLNSVVGKNENGLAWQGNNLVNSSSVTGEYSSAGTNTMFKGNFIAGKSIRIYFIAVDGYTVSPNMQKNIILDDGTTVSVQSNTSGPTMAYIDFTLPKTVSQFNYPLYFNGSGGAIGTAILKTSMQCS